MLHKSVIMSEQRIIIVLLVVASSAECVSRPCFSGSADVFLMFCPSFLFEFFIRREMHRFEADS